MDFAHRAWRRAALLLFSACLLSACSLSQANTPTGAAPFFPAQRDAAPELAPAELLARFDADSDEAYRIGRGDVVDIIVWGQADLSGKQTVGPDGFVSLPVAGSLRLDELTRDEATARIDAALKPYFRHAKATVAVQEYASNEVLVLGRVAKPGPVRFDRPPSLLEVITRAGGLPATGDSANHTSLTRCAVFRGRDRVVWIDLEPLLRGRSLESNLLLRRNDVVFLPDAADRIVYVMGEVERPGAYPIRRGMSFLDAVAEAGGATDDAAPGRVRLVRPSAGATLDIDLEDLLTNVEQRDLALADGDIVYVPENGISQVGYVLEKLSPASQILLFGAALGL